VKREAYEAIGGHAAVASAILEDVALARAIKASARKIRLRYAADAVRTRMYRNRAQLREGWTKNLTLLFPRPERLVLRTLAWWLVTWWSLAVALAGMVRHDFVWVLFAVLSVPFWLLLYRRIRVAHFSTANNLIACAFGLPIFACLLLRSAKAHRDGRVSWKGRAYMVGARGGSTQTEMPASIISTNESRKMRTGS